MTGLTLNPKQHVIYILANRNHTSTGPVFMDMTDDIATRLRQHQCGRSSQDMFRIDCLVHSEHFTSQLAAQRRLRALKSASRDWVNALIERENPYWHDAAQALQMEPYQKAA